jgi:NarL family two-component system response regulator LiaR
VLVADDNETYGVLLSRFVSSQPDMEVVGLATNGSEAVHLATLLCPDLVLMDLCMPGVDGYQATRVLADTNRGIKVVALTAHRSDDTEQRVRDAGARAFLRKSDVDSMLLDTIRGLADRDEMAIPPTPDGGQALA